MPSFMPSSSSSSSSLASYSAVAMTTTTTLPPPSHEKKERTKKPTTTPTTTTTTVMPPLSTVCNNNQQTLTQLPTDYIPQDRDVICGRGKGSYNRPGNIAFRQYISERLTEYLRCTNKMEKTMFIQDLIERYRAIHGGLFLRPRNNKGSRPNKKKKKKVGDHHHHPGDENPSEDVESSLLSQWEILDDIMAHDKVGHIIREQLSSSASLMIDGVKEDDEHHRKNIKKKTDDDAMVVASSSSSSHQKNPPPPPPERGHKKRKRVYISRNRVNHILGNPHNNNNESNHNDNNDNDNNNHDDNTVDPETTTGDDEESYHDPNAYLYEIAESLSLLRQQHQTQTQQTQAIQPPLEKLEEEVQQPPQALIDPNSSVCDENATMNAPTATTTGDCTNAAALAAALAITEKHQAMRMTMMMMERPNDYGFRRDDHYDHYKHNDTTNSRDHYLTTLGQQQQQHQHGMLSNGWDHYRHHVLPDWTNSSSITTPSPSSLLSPPQPQQPQPQWNHNNKNPTKREKEESTTSEEEDEEDEDEQEEEEEEEDKEEEEEEEVQQQQHGDHAKRQEHDDDDTTKQKEVDGSSTTTMEPYVVWVPMVAYRPLQKVLPPQQITPMGNHHHKTIVDHPKKTNPKKKRKKVNKTEKGTECQNNNNINNSNNMNTMTTNDIPNHIINQNTNDDLHRMMMMMSSSGNRNVNIESLLRSSSTLASYHDIPHIPYRSTPPFVTEYCHGRFPVSSSSLSSSYQQLHDGSSYNTNDHPPLRLAPEHSQKQQHQATIRRMMMTMMGSNVAMPFSPS